MKNRWKMAFFLLLGLNLIVMFVLFAMIKAPIKDQKLVNKENKANFVSFQVASNKKDLNLLINEYLRKEVGESPVDYQVVLDKEVELYGTIPFFSEELDMKLTFEPEALDNGDLILKQKSIKIGKINLPVSYVLNFIRKNYKLPNGVAIQPNEERIYVSMGQIKLKSDTKIKVNEFDLKSDQISFTLLVPVK
ncbi:MULTISPECIES: YpmS family protein [unclassified Bacillus (in: firmicutes)]|uniref:YpmS family protein n=1 Tax=unclassified Bacillus (in: firmicutes) TaxID=185979 RepID=UPI0008E0F73A|nr:MULTISPECIES: YpmS family protein [unclassified Bacillus (in: firmicutes)]SFA92219.1 Uncharacterized protein YpmS [Bacillus sp. UNCCL13]SFQ85844.1 Uncharacterized protein YpmS [Bacillus sp. cl95]